MSTGGEYYFNESSSNINYTDEQSSISRSDYVLEESEIKSTVCDLEN